MEYAAARARLERMVAASTSPTLSAGEVDDLLRIGARPDVDGRLVDDADWEDTYDLNAAAAEGWRWKAAKVAADPNFSGDGTSVSAGDVAKQLLAFADTFDSEAGGSGGLGSTRIAGSTTSGIDPRDLGVVNL